MLKKLLIVSILVTAAWGQSARPATKPEAAASGTIALRGGKLLTVSHGVIENGVLVMQSGRITADS